MKTKVPTQRDFIRQHLLQYGTIEPLTALREYGCYRLGAIIFNLRHKEKMNIHSERTHRLSRITGRPVRFATYSLVDFQEPHTPTQLDMLNDTFNNPTQGIV